MLFLIALLLAVVFTAVLSPVLRKKPLPFYFLAALVSASAVIASQSDAESAFLQTWVIPLFSKGAIATGFWAVVMWAGALSRGKQFGRMLLSVRGQLSIIAALLTLSHAVSRGTMYIQMLLRPRFSPDAVFLTTCLTVLLLLVIMLPLTVLSFKHVRRRVAPKKWKRIQRLAYLFYGLIYVHVLVLYLPPALRCIREYVIALIAYTIVWLIYLIARLRKHP